MNKIINKQKIIKNDNGNLFLTNQNTQQNIILPSIEKKKHIETQMVLYKKNVDLEKNAKIYIERMRKLRNDAEAKVI